MAQAVREALSAYASAEVAIRILHRAMHMAQEHEVPVGGRRLRRFLHPHLESAVEFILGQDEASAIVAMLAPMVRLAPDEDEISQVRPSFQVRSPQQVMAPRGPALPAVPRAARLPTGTGRLPSLPAFDAVEADLHSDSGGGEPVVVIASMDCMRIDDLMVGLEGHAVVHEVPDAVVLLETLETTLASEPIIIVDCLSPSVQPHTMAMLAPELPPEITILLWGADEETRNELYTMAGSRGHWVGCSAAATIEDLVALVGSLA